MKVFWGFYQETLEITEENTTLRGYRKYCYSSRLRQLL